jgi:hypothetical protein
MAMLSGGGTDGGFCSAIIPGIVDSKSIVAIARPNNPLVFVFIFSPFSFIRKCLYAISHLSILELSSIGFLQHLKENSIML